MIIYGTRAAHLKSEQLTTNTCTSCGTKGSVILSVYSRHAHVFWVPLFPIGKKGFSLCEHCKQTLEVKQMPDDLRREYNLLKSETKPPVWQFSGLGLIFALAMGITYTNGEDTKKELKYLANPMKGDTYEYIPEEGGYTAMRVARADKDSVYMYLNMYNINKVTAVDEIDKDENYMMDFQFGYARKDLKRMYDKGDINDIRRK